MAGYNANIAFMRQPWRARRPDGPAAAAPHRDCQSIQVVVAWVDRILGDALVVRGVDCGDAAELVRSSGRRDGKMTLALARPEWVASYSYLPTTVKLGARPLPALVHSGSRGVCADSSVTSRLTPRVLPHSKRSQPVAAVPTDASNKHNALVLLAGASPPRSACLIDSPDHLAKQFVDGARWRRAPAWHSRGARPSGSFAYGEGTGPESTRPLGRRQLEGGRNGFSIGTHGLCINIVGVYFGVGHSILCGLQLRG